MLEDDVTPSAEPLALKGAKFGFAKTSVWPKAEAPIREAYKLAKKLLEAEGAVVEEVELPGEFTTLQDKYRCVPSLSSWSLRADADSPKFHVCTQTYPSRRRPCGFPRRLSRIKGPPRPPPHFARRKPLEDVTRGPARRVRLYRCPPARHGQDRGAVRVLDHAERDERGARHGGADALYWGRRAFKFPLRLLSMFLRIADLWGNAVFPADVVGFAHTGYQRPGVQGPERDAHRADACRASVPRPTRRC